MSNPFYKQLSYNPLQANKGRGLEELVKYQNEIYKSRGICNIQKISTPWIVIRRGKEIVSAFPEEKSTLDFRGTVRGGISVSFDTKECEDERGLPLKYIADHQIDYIRSAIPLGEVSFVLCEIKPRMMHYIIPGQTVVQFWDRWKANKGKRGYNYIPVEYMLPIKPTHTGDVLNYLPVALKTVKQAEKDVLKND